MEPVNMATVHEEASNQAFVDGVEHARRRIAKYLDVEEEMIYDPRVVDASDKAFRILSAAEAPIPVVEEVSDVVAFTAVARIKSGQPLLTSFDIIQIIEDVWIRVKEWILND